jgi:hypothetical protein
MGTPMGIGTGMFKLLQRQNPTASKGGERRKTTAMEQQDMKSANIKLEIEAMTNIEQQKPSTSAAITQPESSAHGGRPRRRQASTSAAASTGMPNTNFKTIK